MKTKDCVVVIPIYKDTLTNYEILSLHRVYLVLYNKYDFVYVTYEGIDFSEYLNIHGLYTNDYINYIYYPSWYFQYHNLGYNYMTTNINFYTNLELYRYMLIYHLDCYLFNDNIDYWISTNIPQIECVFEYENLKWFNGEGLRNISFFKKFIISNQEKIYKLLNNVSQYIFSNYTDIDKVCNEYGAEDIFFSTQLSHIDTTDMPLHYRKFGFSFNYENNYKELGLPTMIHRFGMSNNEYNNLFIIDMIGDVENDLELCIYHPKFLDMNKAA